MADRRPYRRHRARGGRSRGDAEAEGGRGRRRKRRGGIWVFLIASVVPLAAVVAYFVIPQETKDLLASKIRGNVGGRAIAAGIAFAILLVLARIALPAFHNASKTLRGVMARFREMGAGKRILVFPAALAVWLLWFLLQMLFAMDAFLILVMGFVGLLLAVRIVLPGFLPGVLPDLTEEP